MLGAIIVTYRRPPILLDALDAVRSSAEKVDRIVVYDNSPDRWEDPPGDIEYLWDGNNIGLPAAIGASFDRLWDADHLLVLDDDTVLSADAIGHLLAATQARGVGAATVPTGYAREHATEGSVFPWSPTLFTRSAIDAAGPPLGKIFFGWCDWEYATRVRRAGFAIRWLDIDLPVQSLGRTWVGRQYMDARNATYLVSRGRVREPEVRRRVVLATKRAFRARGQSRSIARRGIADGLRGRMGPPPDDLMPSMG